MKKLILTLMLSLSLCACQQHKPELSVFYDTQHTAFSQKTLKGHWVLINYFAAWCHPCVKEIPVLNAFHKMHPQLVVLGVNFQPLSLAKLNAERQQLKINFPVLQHDPAKAWGLTPAAVLPTTLVLNPAGKVFKTIQGPNTSASLNKLYGLMHA